GALREGPERRTTRGAAARSLVRAPSSRAAGIGLALALVVALLGLLRLEFSSAVDRFLPGGEDAPRVFWTRALSQSSGSRTLAMVLEGPTETEARAAASELREKMSSTAYFEWVRVGYGASDEASFVDDFAQRSLSLVAPPPAEPELLGARARELKGRLAGNASALWARQAPLDPLGSFPRWLELAESLNGELRIVDGQLMAASGPRALLFASTKVSALDAPAQRELVEWIEKEIAALGPKIEVA